MDKLIRADEVKAELKKFRSWFDGGVCTPQDKLAKAVVNQCIEIIDKLKPVEVVRCKDCRFWRDTWVAPDGITEHGYCHLEESDDVVVGRWDDDFCSYGERKDNGAAPL